MRLAAILGGAVLFAACSSTASTRPPNAGPDNHPTVAAPSTASAPGYVDAVNALCQALLPKVLAVTNNGNPSGFTVEQFEAQVPAHAKLEKDFDTAVAAIAVPTAAASAHAAFQAYVTYADGIDAQRLAAARHGQAAFEAATKAEDAAYAESAVKQARDAAGFDRSCDAR